MTNLELFRRALYLSQRSISDYQALRKGPDALAKRIVRRKVTAAAFRALGRWGR